MLVTILAILFITLITLVLLLAVVAIFVPRRKGEESHDSNAGKQYEHVTGNTEAMYRMMLGEDPQTVAEEIGERWRPGNEYMWDDYDPESLVDSHDRKMVGVNCLLYSRITVYRLLRDRGFQIEGQDPFGHIEQVDKETIKLLRRFPVVSDVFDELEHERLNSDGPWKRRV